MKQLSGEVSGEYLICFHPYTYKQKVCLVFKHCEAEFISLLYQRILIDHEVYCGNDGNRQDGHLIDNKIRNIASYLDGGGFYAAAASDKRFR